MVKQLRITKSTINFKINLYKLLREYLRIENLSLSLFYVRNYFKHIGLICKLVEKILNMLSFFHVHGEFSIFMVPFPCSFNFFHVHGTFSMLMKFFLCLRNFFHVYGIIPMFMEVFHAHGTFSIFVELFPYLWMYSMFMELFLCLGNYFHVYGTIIMFMQLVYDN